MLNKFWISICMMIFALIIILLFQGHQIAMIETMTASIDNQFANVPDTNSGNTYKDV